MFKGIYLLKVISTFGRVDHGRRKTKYIMTEFLYFNNSMKDYTSTSHAVRILLGITLCLLMQDNEIKWLNCTY